MPSPICYNQQVKVLPFATNQSTPHTPLLNLALIFVLYMLVLLQSVQMVTFLYVLNTHLNTNKDRRKYMFR